MRSFLLATSALVALAAPAAAQWSDNFDSYANNTSLNNVGGWFGWDNVPAAAGTAVNTFARSAPNSLLCTAGVTDAVHPSLGITSGKWRLTAWQFIAAPLAPGGVYFIINNSYSHGGPYTWTGQLHCSGTTIVDDQRTTTPQNLVLNQWIEVRADIDLDANTIAYYYNGGLVSQGAYVVAGGPVAIANIDLFSNGGTCFWDDIVLERRGPRDIVAFDANGDGRADLATANNGTNDVSLYLNNGSGAFGADRYIALTSADAGAIALAAGDLDGDGAADDLAVAGSTSSTICKIVNPNAVSPTRTSMTLPSLVNPVDVAIARLDAGATGDVVVACQGTLFGNGGLAVSLNGTAFTTIALGNYVKVALGDLDGDGDNDIAAVTRGAPDRLALFQNNGVGGFLPAGSIALSSSSFASGLCIGDMDGINGNDIVSLTPNPFAPSNSLNVHKNTGAGALGPARFTTVGPIATAGQLAIDVAMGDFEQDTVTALGTTLLSRKDVCVVNGGLGAPISHHGFTGSAFQSTQTRVVGSNPVACAIADFNLDGQDDLATANLGTGGITVLLTAPTPLADPYGTGCPGTGGLTPVIGHAGGNPISGSTSFAVTLAQANVSSLSGLLISFGTDNSPLGGCTVYVGQPVSTFGFVFTNLLGNATQPFAIPTPTIYQGADIFMQWAVFDANGSFGNILAFSSGMHVQIGQ